jgi:hypothetical protein
MSSPAGHALLQGAVFSSYIGRTYRQEPVLLIRVDMLEREISSEISSFGIGLIIFLQVLYAA